MYNTLVHGTRHVRIQWSTWQKTRRIFYIPLDEQGSIQDDDVVCYFGFMLSSRIHNTYIYIPTQTAIINNIILCMNVSRRMRFCPVNIWNSKFPHNIFGIQRNGALWIFFLASQMDLTHTNILDALLIHTVLLAHWKYISEARALHFCCWRKQWRKRKLIPK